jgi:hypothetical protein
MDVFQQCRDLLDAFAVPVDQWSWLQRGACLGLAMSLGFAAGFELWLATAGRDGDVQRQAIDALQTRITAASRKLAASVGADTKADATDGADADASMRDARLDLDADAATTANTANRAKAVNTAKAANFGAGGLPEAMESATLSSVKRIDWLARVAVIAGDSGLHLDKLQPGSSGGVETALGPAIQIKARGTFADLLRFGRRLATLIPDLVPEEVDVVGTAAQLRMVATLRVPRQSGPQPEPQPGLQAGHRASQPGAASKAVPDVPLAAFGRTATDGSNESPGADPQSFGRPQNPASATDPGEAQQEQLDPFGGPALSAHLAIRSIGVLSGIFVQGNRRAALVQSGDEFALLKVGTVRAGARVTRIGNRSITVAVGALPAYTMVLAGPSP